MVIIAVFIGKLTHLIARQIAQVIGKTLDLTRLMKWILPALITTVAWELMPITLTRFGIAIAIASCALVSGLWIARYHPIHSNVSRTD